MEITKEQIQRVEHYLNVKNIVYKDIRMEVFDHIISDIEAKMEDENLDFKTIFYSVTDKWNKHLKDTTSFYFGIGYSAPKIVIEKAKKTFKKWFFLLPLVFLTTDLLIQNNNIVFSETIINGLNLFFQLTSILIFVSFVGLMIFKSINKDKTTYSFILKTQSLGVLIGAFCLVDFDYFKNDGTLDGFQVGLLLGFILMTYCYYIFYKKHKQAIKKYKIS